MNEWENNQQDAPQENEPERPVYVWSGKPGKRKPSSRKSGVFCAIAVLCLLLTAALCVPTILFATREPGTETVSDTASESVSASESNGGVTDVVEVSQTVEITTTPYEENSIRTQVYEKCAPSCATIYVTFERANGYVIGSGFVLTKDGYVATNQHVVDGGKKFKVIFYDGNEYEARLVGEDAMRDLAVLKIDADVEFVPLEIGDSSALQIGQSVIAIGTPYDLELAGTLTQGSISGLDRKIEIENDYGTVIKTMRLIQTDASINPGNSGGPLINLGGQVIGINSLKMVNEYEGIGFAIPINYAVDIFNQLIQFGTVMREPDDDFVTSNPRLGVTVTDVETGLTQMRIRPTCEYPKDGIFVVSVEPNTAVYEAGLQYYNIITEFDGEKITSVQELTQALSKHKAGDTVKLKVFCFSRNFASGEYHELTFVLDAAA